MEKPSKDIQFPEQQLEGLSYRLQKGLPIYTTRVSKDYARYKTGDTLKSPLGVLKVLQQQKLNDVSQHPFVQDLTPQQQQLLAKYRKLKLLKLVAQDKANRTSSLDDIRSIQDLKNFYIKKHKYGLVDFSADKHWKDTHKNTTFQDWQKNWRFLSPQQILKYKAGVCYDTAGMTDYYLTKWGIQHLNLFAYTKRSKGDAYNDDPTHTFTIYKDKDNKWRWLQGAWQPYKNNNWQQDSPEKLINNIGKALANSSGQTNLIGVIRKFPEYGVDMNTFYHKLKKDILGASIQVSPDRKYNKQILDKKAVALNQLKRYARPHYTPDKWRHILNVLRIAREYKGIPLSDEQKAAILWHDSSKRDKGAFRHGEFGARVAEKELPKWYTPQQVRIVAKAIRQHNLDERIKDPQTFQQTLKSFASPQAELLAVADDDRGQDTPQDIWRKTLSYHITGSTKDKTPQELVAHMKRRLPPKNRMPELKYYKQKFLQRNKPFTDWVQALTPQQAAVRIKKYKKERGL